MYNITQRTSSDSIKWCMYVLEEQSCQISSRSNLKWQSIRFFKQGRRNNDKMTSDVVSVPDPKKIYQYLPIYFMAAFCESKNTSDTKLLLILVRDWFSKFFHWHTRQETCSKTITRDANIAQTCIHCLVKYYFSKIAPPKSTQNH